MIVIYLSRQSRGKSVDTGCNKKGKVPQGRCDLETGLKIKSFFSFSHSLTFFRLQLSFRAFKGHFTLQLFTLKNPYKQKLVTELLKITFVRAG